MHKHLRPAITAVDFEDKLAKFYTSTFEPYKDEETKPLMIPKGMIHKTLTNTMELKYYYPQGTP